MNSESKQSSEVKRRKLPARRQQRVRHIEHGDFVLEIGVGLYPDGTPGEAFISSSAKSGSDVQALLDDAGILISLLLQHGVSAEEMGKVVSRIESEQSARSSAIGAAIDAIASVQRFESIERRLAPPATNYLSSEARMRRGLS